MKLFLVLFSWCLLINSVLVAEDTKGLDIALISETKTIVAGKPFTVGLHIRHDDGFHTYWKNPGIVGLATNIEWDLPPGFKAGPIQWPYPELTKMATHPCHGYERDVTLLVVIVPPKDLKKDTSVKLVAKTRWMCCARNCYPGFRSFTLQLPVAQKAKVDLQALELIKSARKELPTPVPGWEAKLLSKPNDRVIRLHITSPDKESRPRYVFSEDGQISSDQKQQFTSQPDGSFLLEIERSEFSPENRTKLPVIIHTGETHVALSPVYPSEEKGR